MSPRSCGHFSVSSCGRPAPGEEEQCAIASGPRVPSAASGRQQGLSLCASSAEEARESTEALSVGSWGSRARSSFREREGDPAVREGRAGPVWAAAVLAAVGCWGAAG